MSAPPRRYVEDPPTKLQLRLKSLTILACVGVAAAGLLTDWEDVAGGPHFFSGVKPAVKSFFNSLYGAKPPAEERRN